VIWKSQIDFAGAELTLKDVYIGMKGLGCLGTAKVGNFKEPYSLEELASSKYITFMERALPSVFDSSRNFGLGFSNAILDERMTWATGVFADSNDGGEYFSGDANFNVSSRVTGLPLYADDGRQLIHLGFSGSYQVRDDTTVRARQRPEIHLAQRYVDTGDLQTDGNGLIAAEIAGVFGPVHVSSEYKHAFINQVDGKDLDLYGAYVQAGWFLTGESRPYKKSAGTWSRVKPKNPFDPDAGKWGAFEVASRFSYIDLNSHNANGGKERNVTVGLNWYLYSNVRLTANYVYADVRSTGDNLGNARGAVHGAQARAQIEF
jgi:phosphate-selective porin OprO/OprP